MRLGAVDRGGDLADGLAHRVFDFVEIAGGQRDAVGVDSEGVVAAVGCGHISSEPFPPEHQILIEKVVADVGAGFGEDVSRSGSMHLNIEERAVAAEDGERALKQRKIRLLRHVGQEAAHEIGSEQSVASGAIGL